jgi:hypothetical protein
VHGAEAQHGLEVRPAPQEPRQSQGELDGLGRGALGQDGADERRERIRRERQVGEHAAQERLHRGERACVGRRSLEGFERAALKEGPRGVEEAIDVEMHR